jgi:hypothetical protein
MSDTSIYAYVTLAGSPGLGSGQATLYVQTYDANFNPFTLAA